MDSPAFIVKNENKKKIIHDNLVRRDGRRKKQFQKQNFHTLRTKFAHLQFYSFTQLILCLLLEFNQEKT